MVRQGTPGAGEDAELLARLQPYAQPAGSATFWDWRVPHSSTPTHGGREPGAAAGPREAVYAGFLPDVPLNRKYAAGQLDAYRRRTLPPDFGGGKEIPAQFLAPIMPPGEEGTSDEVLARMGGAGGLAQRLLGATPWAQARGVSDEGGRVAGHSEL